MKKGLEGSLFLTRSWGRAGTREPQVLGRHACPSPPCSFGNLIHQIWRCGHAGLRKPLLWALSRALDKAPAEPCL